MIIGKKFTLNEAIIEAQKIAPHVEITHVWFFNVTLFLEIEKRNNIIYLHPYIYSNLSKKHKSLDISDISTHVLKSNQWEVDIHH